jgi:hypothetical protein
MKKSFFIGIIMGLILGLILGLIISYIIFSEKASNENTKLKICPDAWYLNQMATYPEDKTPPSQYFIIDEERRELSEFDIDWIKENCEINTPTPVY